MKSLCGNNYSRNLFWLYHLNSEKKVETRFYVNSILAPSKFPLFYGFDILFILFILLFSCLGSKFLLVFNCRFTFLFICFLVNLFFSVFVSHSCPFFSLYLPQFIFLFGFSTVSQCFSTVSPLPVPPATLLEVKRVPVSSFFQNSQVFFILVGREISLL